MWDVLPLLNFALCLGIVWSCICRLNSELCRRYLAPRTRYTLLLTGAVASGLQPVAFSAHPGLGTLLLSLAVVASLFISARWWPAPENTPPHHPCENHHDHH